MATVARVRTSPTIAQWRDAIAAAWPADSAPTDEALAVLWAQFALETGRSSSCWCWNLGNIMPGGGWTGDVQELATFEIVKGERVDVVETFRAYLSLADGARDYVRFQTRAAYREAWACVVRGDARGFAIALKRLGYYTADAVQYANGLLSLASEFLRYAAKLKASTITPTAAEDDALECLEPADFEPGTFHHDLRSSLVCSTCHEVTDG